MNKSQLFFQTLTPITNEDFYSFFDTFNKTAFRFESLDMYNIDGEQEEFLLYKKGLLDIKKAKQESMDFYVKMNTNNKCSSLVRFISPTINKDYLKYCIDLAYTTGLSCGAKVGIIKDINILEYKSNIPILFDYWLFDDTVCILMVYDLVGRSCRKYKVDNEYVLDYVNFSETLMCQSEPLERFLQSGFFR